MATDRKQHNKNQRLAGIAKRKRDAKASAHQKDLQTLQKVLDHSDALRQKRPDLFAAVLDSVQTLATANGVTVESIMRDGVMVIGNDGHKISKSPQDILKDIAGLHPSFQMANDVAAGARAILDSRGNVMKDGDNEEFTETDPFAELSELPSLERQREAAQKIKSGLGSLDVATCSDTALQEAMACGSPVAAMEWQKRHPEEAE